MKIILVVTGEKGKNVVFVAEPNKRGLQIAGEFYRLAQKWLP